MADFLNTEAMAESGAALMQTVQMVMVFLVFAVLAIGIAFFIIRALRFKYRVAIRDVVNGRAIVKLVKAREFTDKKGVNYWKLKGIRNPDERLMDVPDSRCIDTDEKGNKWVEVYRLPTGGYIPIYDLANLGTIPDDIDSIASTKQLEAKELIIKENKEGLERDQKILAWKKSVIALWIKENGFDKAFRPFTTQDRQAVVNNIKDAQERKHKGFMEQLPSIVAIGSMALIIVCLLIFAPDWFEAKNNLNTQQAAVVGTLKEIALIQKDIKLGIQTMSDDQDDLTQRISSIEKNKPIPN